MHLIIFSIHVFRFKYSNHLWKLLLYNECNKWFINYSYNIYWTGIGNSIATESVEKIIKII